MSLFEKSTKHPITYELLPPRGSEGKHIEAISLFKKHLDALTVTDNPMATLRASSIAYGKIAKNMLDMEIIPNLSCRDRNLLALQSEVMGAHMLGFRNLFIITGDVPKQKRGFKGVWEVNAIEFCKIIKGLNIGVAKVRGVQQELTGSTEFSVGGAIVLNRINEHETLTKKIEVGFDYFITQITFDADEVIEFYSKFEEKGDKITKHVQIGFCTPSSYKKFKTINLMPGVLIKPGIINKFEKSSNYKETLLSHLLETSDKIESNLKSYKIGFHVMPMGSDELGGKLVEEIKK
ncbi:methylenetetrahydrofolate reductase [Candidatus Bathyarchaeota archaeon]|nr:methylenetetrahydrofolate reductase [Candidatus Bathyarchaeota archaeon]